MQGKFRTRSGCRLPAPCAPLPAPRESRKGALSCLGGKLPRPRQASIRYSPQTLRRRPMLCLVARLFHAFTMIAASHGSDRRMVGNEPKDGRVAEGDGGRALPHRNREDMFAGRRTLVSIASGWLLASGWIAGWSRADDFLPVAPRSPSAARFEDTAVATLNSKVDAAAQAAPAQAAPRKRRRP